MERRSRTEPDVLNWVFLLLTLLLAGLHLYLGLFGSFVTSDRAMQFIIIALVLLVGPLLYVTPYWRPLLYLLGVGFATYLGGLWVFGGMEYFPFGVLAGIFATGFIILGLSLFYREDIRTANDGS